jgi:hypothetical protein
METLVTSQEIIETIEEMEPHERMCFDNSVDTCLGVLACVKSIIDQGTNPVSMLSLAILMGAFLRGKGWKLGF